MALEVAPRRVWETGAITACAGTYDAIYPTLAGDEKLQRESGKSGAEIARQIETNILREAARHVMVTGKIQGNFGMHQETLLTIALALALPCGLRLDRLLTGELGLSRAQLGRLHDTGALCLSPASRKALRGVIADGQTIAIDLASLESDLAEVVRRGALE